MAWVVGLLVVVAVAIVATIAIQRRTSAAAEAEPSPPTQAPRPRAVDQPMSGLESALSDVTDRDGRPIGERIDAGAQHVDDLRVPDDTGPVLRRALDHVERLDESSTIEAESVDTGDTAGGADRPVPVDGPDEQR